VLRDLAVSSSPVFNVGDAALPLIAALPESAGKTKLDVAEVLARINQKRTQVAVMEVSKDVVALPRHLAAPRQSRVRRGLAYITSGNINMSYRMSCSCLAS
jgi:HEAT repeat protein